MRKFRRFIRLLLLLAISIVCLLCVSHRVHTPQRGAHTLDILTWNTHMMDKANKADHNAILAYLRANPVDVVCLQEVELRRNNHYLTLESLKQSMHDLYPYTYIDFKVYNKYRQYGNVVLSRYPLINKQTVRYDSRANISSRCDIVVDGDTIRLITNHLESNRLVASDWMDTLNTDEVKHAAERISIKMQQAGRVRRRQAQVLRQEIKQSPYPILVAGDCNTIPLSRVYLLLRGRLRDTFLEGSFGRIGSTFTYHHIGVRIDYIFCSRKFDVLDSRVDYDAEQSDHYPLRTRLSYTRF